MRSGWNPKPIEILKRLARGFFAAWLRPREQGVWRTNRD
jgi:hypothetical protein